jgi:hypothetical protein
MIKIYFNGSTYLHQNDRSYNLPSVTGAVQWNGGSKRFEVSTGGAWMPIDNMVEINGAVPDVWEMHRWIESKKQEDLKVKELRDKYPALDEAYNHMEMIKALVSTDSDK